MAPDPRLVQAVVSQAQAAGMNPLDLLTIIGYETAGSYRADQPGPRTKWGQHRGYIQWGEPQARKYNVDFANPEQQVSAAIQYLRDHGWRPGMGRLEMYAAINAGDVSKVGARDAAAGGAPGTVADKVNYQMKGHEARARNLLSQYDVPGGFQPPLGLLGAGGIPGGVIPSELPAGGIAAAPAGLIAPATQTPSAPPAAPTAPYSVAPNSDAARMLSDPTRYGLSADQSAQMRTQMAAGGPGGGVIGNIPAPSPPAPVPTPPAPPPGILSPAPSQGQNPPGVLSPPPSQPREPPQPEAQGTAATLFDDWRNRRPLGLFQGGWT